MAVYTRLKNDQLNFFIQKYNIGDVVSLTEIKGGIDNTNYFLKTTKDIFLLTIYEKRIQVDELPFFIELMEHLKKNGLNCPMPVKAKDGKALQEIFPGKWACITTFLSGQSVKNLKIEHCFELGKAMALMHRSSANFNKVRKNDLSISGWEKLIAKIGQNANRIAPRLYDELCYEFEDIKSQWPSNLPTGIIHADLFPDNVFFTENLLSGIIDFYFACSDFYAYELAICINAWCFENYIWEFNATKAAYLIAGYTKIRKLSIEEKQSLPILCRGAALRFLLTRIYDWINQDPLAFVTPKDPNEYIKKLRFHHKVKSYFEYGFFD
ncbi:MAG: homoserine kinase [Alphaproteobacteria bacterium]|nr:homoserine kinase [Alphaproteobacteria bacterium]